MSCAWLKNIWLKYMGEKANLVFIAV